MSRAIYEKFEGPSFLLKKLFIPTQVVVEATYFPVGH